MPMLRRGTALTVLLLLALAGPLLARGPGGGYHAPGPTHFAQNAVAFVGDSNLALIEVTPNRAWIFPYAGYTLYPGQAGSGYGTRSDYSHINWLVPPEQNAGMVRGRLRLMGIPAVPPEPIFLNKNPAITDNLRLPIPRPKTPKEPEKEVEK